MNFITLMSAFQRVCYKFSVASSGPNCATPGYLRHGGGAGGRAFVTMSLCSIYSVLKVSTKFRDFFTILAEGPSSLWRVPILALLYCFDTLRLPEIGMLVCNGNVIKDKKL